MTNKHTEHHHEKDKHIVKKRNFRVGRTALVIAILITALAIFYDKPKNTEAEKIAEVIFDHTPASFAKDGVIDQGRLEEIQKMDYVELKNALDVKSDFCIYVEDENGNIILEKGSEKLSEGGVYCG